MKKNMATKIVIWIILILLSLALILPFITPLFQKFSGSSVEQTQKIDINNIQTEIQVSTPESARKAQEDAIAAINATSKEIEREENINTETISEERMEKSPEESPEILPQENI